MKRRWTRAPVAGVATLDELDERLAGQLVEHARARGTGLVGPEGLLGRLTKLVFETALEAEMGEHRGYEPREAPGGDSGNSGDGVRPKTLSTEIGPFEFEVPRDRDATFEPKLVRKRQRRLSGVQEMVCSLVAKGLTTGGCRRTWVRSTAPGSARTPSAASPGGSWRACRGGRAGRSTRGRFEWWLRI